MLGLHLGRLPAEQLMKAACSMGRTIDPRRPKILTPDETASINNLPCVLALSQKVQDLLQSSTSKESVVYKKAMAAVRNEKSRQRKQLLKAKKARFNKEQPSIDIELQLSGIRTDMIKVITQPEAEISPQHTAFAYAIFSKPAATVEQETARRIRAIKLGTICCAIEEGRLVRSPAQLPAVQKNEQTRDQDRLEAIKSILPSDGERPRRCFVCALNPKLPEPQRFYEFANESSARRHFRKKHLIPLPKHASVKCRVCNITLHSREHWQHHAQVSHGMVSQPMQTAKIMGKVRRLMSIGIEMGGGLRDHTICSHLSENEVIEANSNSSSSKSALMC